VHGAAGDDGVGRRRDQKGRGSHAHGATGEDAAQPTSTNSLMITCEEHGAQAGTDDLRLQLGLAPMIKLARLPRDEIHEYFCS
jgi:hypothetical protein